MTTATFADTLRDWLTDWINKGMDPEDIRHGLDIVAAELMAATNNARIPPDERVDCYVKQIDEIQVVILAMAEIHGVLTLDQVAQVEVRLALP